MELAQALDRLRPPAPAALRMSSSPALRPPVAKGSSANHLLAALPDREFVELLPDLEFVDLPLGRVLYDAGQVLSHAYFPTTSVVSIVQLLEDGSATQSALVGNEGMVGIAMFMGGGSTPDRAVVNTAGQGFRLGASTLRRAFERCGPVTNLMLRYAQALLTQMAQSAVCYRHHKVEQQLCRALLLYLDRLPGSEIVMTQERMAGLLGVRRESITAAIHSLHRAGIVFTSRGHITVSERRGLEGRACECYSIVKRESDRLLSMPAMGHLAGRG